MPEWLLQIEVISGPLPWIVWLLALAGVAVLLIRRPTKRWVRRALIGIAAGVLVAVAAVLYVDLVDPFGTPLPDDVQWWVGAACGSWGLAVVNLWDSKVWRKIIAIVVALLVLGATALGVNAVFGIDRTLGGMLGLPTVEPIAALPALVDRTDDADVAATWEPPADLPAHGEVGRLSGDLAIASSAGFSPRDATIYLPPAALVADPPVLPLVVFMMGHPGNPDPTFIQEVLDGIAAEHAGLAPIVLVVDQLGSRSQDPVCADSSTYGGVATYVNDDVPGWALAHLNITPDTSRWTIAGFSNGGACALKWAAENPQTWGNLLDVSGDRQPGVENFAAAVADVYDGDRDAYDDDMPDAHFIRNDGHFADHVAVFTAGSDDDEFSVYVDINAAAATGAGFDVTTVSVPAAHHDADALIGGLRAGFEVLYPRLGLTARGGTGG